MSDLNNIFDYIYSGVRRHGKTIDLNDGTEIEAAFPFRSNRSAVPYKP